MTPCARLRPLVLLILLWFAGALAQLPQARVAASRNTASDPTLDRLLPARVEIFYQALDRRFDPARSRGAC